eukprot:COSAG03_NODE_18874_length_346_cov_1.048583_1_plen_44_part_01
MPRHPTKRGAAEPRGRSPERARSGTPTKGAVSLSPMQAERDTEV